MKRIIASLAAVAMVAGAAPAFAQSISPANTTVTLTGDLFVKQLLSSDCDAEIDLQVNSAGTAGSITRLDLTGGTVCGGISPNLPWAVTLTGPGAGTIAVDADTSAGWCRGPLQVLYDVSTGKVVIPRTPANEVDGKIFGFITEKCVIASNAPHLDSSPAISF